MLQYGCQKEFNTVYFSLFMLVCRIVKHVFCMPLTETILSHIHSILDIDSY